MNIVLVSPWEVSATGHGGSNRTNQVYLDLLEAFPNDLVFPYQWGNYSDPRKNHTYRKPTFGKRLVRKAIRFADRLASKINRSPRSVYGDEWFDKYEGLATLDHFESVLDHFISDSSTIIIVSGASLAPAVRISRARNIPTLITPQNIDALAVHATLNDSIRDTRAACKALSLELDIYGKCNHILAISEAELSFFQGLGLRSSLYPYRPRGDFYNKLLDIRIRRRERRHKTGNILLLGTAAWRPVSEGLEFALEAVRQKPLSNGRKLIVAGLGVNDLKRPPDQQLGIEFRGRLAPEDYETLLVECDAALVPVACGFGTPTRITDFACANVPVITTPLASYSGILCPGVRVTNQWTNLNDTIDEISNNHAESEIDEWLQNRQPYWVDWIAKACHDSHSKSM
jgi:hypothetical protein